MVASSESQLPEGTRIISEVAGMVYEVGFWSDGEEVGFLNALKWLSPRGRRAWKRRLDFFWWCFS